MEIRPIREADVPETLELVATVLAEFGLAFGEATDEELRALPASYETGAFWVATHDGALAGTCGVFPLEPHTFELRKMFLRPAARGLGIGARLFDVALAWVRERGAQRIVLDTTEAMTRAIAFYEARGFVRDDAYIRGSRCSRGYVLDLR